MTIQLKQAKLAEIAARTKCLLTQIELMEEGEDEEEEAICALSDIEKEQTAYLLDNLNTQLWKAIRATGQQEWELLV